MSEARTRHALETYDLIKRSFERGNWAELERTFREFVSAYPIPEWYIDEVVFQGMKLWKEDRPTDLLRNFGRVLDRVAGEPVVFNLEEAQAIGTLLLEARA
jgi:hypothetical protein